MSQTHDPLQGTIDGRVIRGGTSKGFFVRDTELPDVSDELLDLLVLELFGTPDPLQVDGLGGSHSHTSKLMIVGSSDREGVDLDYTFGQVGIENAVIDWSGNCGNLTSAIGTFGILERLVDPASSPAKVTLYNTNSDTVIEQTIPLRDGVPDPYGTYGIDGVPGTGARVDSTFLDPAGGVFGSLAPTGSVTEEVSVDGQPYRVTLVDVTNPCVFVRAADLGLTGTELPRALSADPDLLETLELIRGSMCARLGLVETAGDAELESPTAPFIAVVSEPQSYDCSVNKSINANQIDITARIVTTQTPHHAYAMTGAMCLAAASQIPGSVPNDVVRGRTERVTIGHPKGTISVGVSASNDHIDSVTVSRTVREIMRGTALYRYVDKLERLAS